jgi:hypothetical protein
MSRAKSTQSHLSALTEQLDSITAQISNLKGNSHERRVLVQQRVAVFQQIHHERHRLRIDALTPAQVLSRLQKVTSLSPQQNFALRVAVELFQVVPNEEIHYAVRQARSSRH